MPRTAKIHRKTNETDINIRLNLDGRGKARVASGIRFCVVNAKIASARVGDFQTELTEDFFQGFAQAARANVHLRVLYGRSSHHQIEAMFKAFARALRFAVARDKRLRRVLPSTKGLL